MIRLRIKETSPSSDYNLWVQSLKSVTGNNAIVGIKARVNILNSSMTGELILEFIDDITITEIQTIGESIREVVSKQYGITIKALQSKSRLQKTTLPRQMAMYLTRKHTELSLSDIGLLYNRDHSTVLYAIDSVTIKISENQAIRKQLEILENHIV